MHIRGPLVIGIANSDIQLEDDEDEEEDDEEDEDLQMYKIEFLFDYEEDKMVVFDFDKKLDPKEMKKLSFQFTYQPCLG